MPTQARPESAASITVGVPNRHQSATHRRAGAKRSVVANRVSRCQGNEASDAALNAHPGAHACQQWHRRRRRYAVECDSNPCDGVLGSAPGQHTGAICDVKRRQPHSEPRTASTACSNSWNWAAVNGSPGSSAEAKCVKMLAKRRYGSLAIRSARATASDAVAP